MKQIALSTWRWVQENLADAWVRHIAPWVSCVAVLSGGFLTYDLSPLRERYPDWPGLFNLLDAGLLFWVFILTAILTAVTSWFAACRQKSLDALKDQLSQKEEAIQQVGQNIRLVFDALLLNLARKMGISQEHQTRLSLYVHADTNGNFIPCGRYSSNPRFNLPGTRTTYPDGHGCIACGWEKGWHFDSDFPRKEDNDTINDKEYRKLHAAYCQSEYEIPQQTHKYIRMLSTTYAVLRIDDSRGKQLAVLVLETIQPDRFEEKQVKEELIESTADFPELIRTLYSYIPNPNDAAARGL